MAKPNTIRGRVQEVLDGLKHVGEVNWDVSVQKCRGRGKVKLLRPRDNGGAIALTIFDGDNGVRRVLIPTCKPGAIARILPGRLNNVGVSVEVIAA